MLNRNRKDFSVRQESGRGSSGSSASGSHKAAVKVSARTGSHLRLSGGRIHFQANILVVRSQFLVLMGCQPEAMLSSLACGPLCRAVYFMKSNKSEGQ